MIGLTAGAYYFHRNNYSFEQCKNEILKKPRDLINTYHSKKFADIIKKYRICFSSDCENLNDDEKKIYQGASKKYFYTISGIIDGHNVVIASFVLTDNNKVFRMEFNDKYPDLLEIINYFLGSSDYYDRHRKFKCLGELAEKLEGEYCLNYVEKEIPQHEIKRTMFATQTVSGKIISFNIDELKNYYARTQNLMTGIFKYYQDHKKTDTYYYNLNLAINPHWNQIPFNGACLIEYTDGLPNSLYTPLGYLSFNPNCFKHCDDKKLKETLGLIEIVPAYMDNSDAQQGPIYLITKDFNGQSLKSDFTKEQLEVDDPISHDSAKQLWKLVRPKVRVNLIEWQ